MLILTVNLLLGNKTSDPMSGFFMFKKSLFERSKKKMVKKGYKILLDLIYNESQKIKVIDTHPYPQTDKPMNNQQKKEFEKEKQRRKKEFFANRNKKKGFQNRGRGRK